MFDLITDILADLVLEDVNQFPRTPVRPIDSVAASENTLLPEGKGKE
jgi:hypothetical protein